MLIFMGWVSCGDSMGNAGGDVDLDQRDVHVRTYGASFPAGSGGADEGGAGRA